MLTFRVRNISALAANFVKAGKIREREIKALVADFGERNKDIVRLTCAFDTGFMSDHVRTEYSKGGMTYQTGWLYEDFSAQGFPLYPVFVELGTSRQAAQPSLRPAFNRLAPQFNRELMVVLTR